ncbi:MAG: hypothetical protein GWP08_18630 [Nitrospiraceae bacterium]|nr:hypothetical protein [Nitrospiraceae bacterium]
MTSDQEWEEIVRTRPSDVTPTFMEAMFRLFAKFWQDRDNARSAERYGDNIRSWLMQYRGNGVLTPIPIPPYRVEYVPRLIGIGWIYDEVDQDEFVTDPWEPDDKFLSKLSADELAIIGYEPPPPPQSGIARVGPRLPNGWYAVLAGDTVPSGAEIPYQGLRLRKVTRAGMGRGYRWYEVVSP